MSNSYKALRSGTFHTSKKVVLLGAMNYPYSASPEVHRRFASELILPNFCSLHYSFRITAFSIEFRFCSGTYKDTAVTDEASISSFCDTTSNRTR